MKGYYWRKSKDDSMKIIIICAIGFCVFMAIAIVAELMGY